MSEERKRTVKVMCSIPNGVELRLYAPGHDDGTGSGQRMQQRVTGSVTLRGPSAVRAGINSTTGEPVVTEVDAEFWEAWQAQNKMPPSFIAAGQVGVVKDT